MSEKFNNFIIASKKLENVKNRAFNYIKKNIGRVSEYDVQKFIILEFKKEHLVNTDDFPIVAFRTNTSFVHYFPKRKSKIIEKNSIILIDLWAKYGNGYYADITWMGYTGKVPKYILDKFNHVINSRNIAIEYIKNILKNKKLPKAKEVDKVVRDYFDNNKLEKYFLHSTGHS